MGKTGDLMLFGPIWARDELLGDTSRLSPQTAGRRSRPLRQQSAAAGSSWTGRGGCRCRPRGRQSRRGRCSPSPLCRWSPEGRSSPGAFVVPSGFGFEEDFFEDTGSTFSNSQEILLKKHIVFFQLYIYFSLLF